MLRKISDPVDFDCGVIVLKGNHIVYFNNVAKKLLRDSYVGTIEEFSLKMKNSNQQSLSLQNLKISIHNVETFQIIVFSKNKTELIKKLTYEINELEAIMESSFDEIFVTDGDGYTLKINKAAEKNYDIPRNRVIGKHVSELEKSGYFNPSFTLKAIKKRQRVTGMQTTNRGETLVVTSNPIIDESTGKIVRVVTNSRNITELMTLQKELQNSQNAIKVYQNILSSANPEKKDFIASDDAMKIVMETVKKISNTEATILLEGETGVGKSMLAKKIHLLSARHNKPFITINCAAIPQDLMEAELFGYESGSFTGAKNTGKKGLVECANDGTVFFDEIAEIPLQIQNKLLDVIQEKRLRRIGANKYISTDIRIISATNRDLKNLVQQKLFREDLFYRLNVIPITVPPLRYRKEAIKTLSIYFLKKYNLKYKYKKILSDTALNYMQQYAWPGNIRELENLVERLAITSNTDEIMINDLPDYINKESGINRNDDIGIEDLNLHKAMQDTEYKILQEALSRFNSTYEIAEALNINQSTVVRKMQKLNLTKRRK